MRGVPRRQNPGSSIIFDPDSEWSQPLYACASTVKATIKTVSFAINGTGGIDDIKITGSKPKTYSDASNMPLWGYENTRNAYSLDELPMIWGLLSSDYENHPNVSSIRQESLYLTGYYSSGIGTSTFSSNSMYGDENLPASDFYSDAMGSAYAVCSGDLCSSGQEFDYSGDTNMAMWAKWQSLSNSPTTAALIPNLIFTDYAAAAVVGTKGVLGSGNAATSNLVRISVTPTHSVIRYRWAFAIPAFLISLFLLIFTTLAFATIFVHRHNVGNMRMHLDQLAPGRILTALVYPEHGLTTLSSKEWSKQMGDKVIDLSGGEVIAGKVSTGYELVTTNSKSATDVALLRG